MKPQRPPQQNSANNISDQVQLPSSSSVSGSLSGSGGHPLPQNHLHRHSVVSEGILSHQSSILPLKTNAMARRGTSIMNSYDETGVGEADDQETNLQNGNSQTARNHSTILTNNNPSLVVIPPAHNNKDNNNSSSTARVKKMNFKNVHVVSSSVGKNNNDNSEHQTTMMEMSGRSTNTVQGNRTEENDHDRDDVNQHGKNETKLNNNNKLQKQKSIEGIPLKKFNISSTMPLFGSPRFANPIRQQSASKKNREEKRPQNSPTPNAMSYEELEDGVSLLSSSRKKPKSEKEQFDVHRMAVLEKYGIAGDHALPWERNPGTAPQVTMLPHFLPLPKPPQQSQPGDKNLYRSTRMMFSNNNNNNKNKVVGENEKNQEEIVNAENDREDDVPNDESKFLPKKRPDGLTSIFSRPTMTKQEFDEKNKLLQQQQRPQTSENINMDTTSSAAFNERPKLLQRRAVSAKAVQDRIARDAGKGAYGVSLHGEFIQDSILRTTSHRTKVPSLLELARAIPSEALADLESLKQILSENGGLLETVPNQTSEMCSVVLPLGAHGAEFGPQRRSGHATSDEVVHFLVGGIGFKAFKEAATRPEVNEAILDWQSDMSTPRRGRRRNSPGGLSGTHGLTWETVGAVPSHGGYIHDWMFKNFLMGEDGTLSATRGFRKGSVADGLDSYSPDRFKRDGIPVDPRHLERSRQMAEALWGRHAKQKWITVAKHYAIVKKALREISLQALPMFKMLRNRLLERTKPIFVKSGNATRELFEKLLEEKSKSQKKINEVEREADWERRVSLLVHQGSLNLLDALAKEQQQEQDENEDEEKRNQKKSTVKTEKEAEKKAQVSFELLSRVQSMIDGLGSGLGQQEDDDDDESENDEDSRNNNNNKKGKNKSKPSKSKAAVSSAPKNAFSADIVAFKSITEFLQDEQNRDKMKQASKKIRRKMLKILQGSAPTSLGKNGRRSLASRKNGDSIFNLDHLGSDVFMSDPNFSSALLELDSDDSNNYDDSSSSSHSSDPLKTTKTKNKKHHSKDHNSSNGKKYRKYSYFSKSDFAALQDFVQSDPKKYSIMFGGNKSKNNQGGDDYGNAEDGGGDHLELLRLMSGVQSYPSTSDIQQQLQGSDILGVAKAVLEKAYDIAEQKLIKNGLTNMNSIKVTAANNNNNIQHTTNNINCVSSSVGTSPLNTQAVTHLSSSVIGSRSSPSSSTSSPSSSNHLANNINNNNISNALVVLSDAENPSLTPPTFEVDGKGAGAPKSSRLNTTSDATPILFLKNRLVFGGIKNQISASSRVEIPADAIGLDVQKHIRPLISKINLLDSGFRKALHQVGVLARAAEEIPSSAFFAPTSPSSSPKKKNLGEIGNFSSFNNKNGKTGDSSSPLKNNNNNRKALSRTNSISSAILHSSEDERNNDPSDNDNSSPVKRNRSFSNNNNNNISTVLSSNDESSKESVKHAVASAFVASAFRDAGGDAKAKRDGQLFRVKSNDVNISNHGNYYCDLWTTCERAAQALKKMSGKIRDASLTLRNRRRRTQAMMEVKNEVERAFVQAAHDRERRNQTSSSTQHHPQRRPSATEFLSSTFTNASNNNNFAQLYERRLCILDRVPFDVRLKLFGVEANFLRDARRSALFAQKKAERTGVVLSQLEQPTYGDGSGGDRRLALAKRIIENEKMKAMMMKEEAGSPKRGGGGGKSYNGNNYSSATSASNRYSRPNPFYADNDDEVLKQEISFKLLSQNTRNGGESSPTRSSNNKKSVSSKNKIDAVAASSSTETNKFKFIGALGIIDEASLWKEIDEAEDRLRLAQNGNANNNFSPSSFDPSNKEQQQHRSFSRNNNNNNFLDTSNQPSRENSTSLGSRSNSFIDHSGSPTASGLGKRKRKSPQQQKKKRLLGENSSLFDIFGSSSNNLTNTGSRVAGTNAPWSGSSPRNKHSAKAGNESPSPLDNTLSTTVTSVVELGALYYGNNSHHQHHQQRDVAIQNCIEDERTMKCYELVDQLRSEETTSISIIQRICNTAANLTLLVTSIESDLSCRRCLQVLRQPQIIAPCGTTVCRSCVLATDDQRLDEFDAGFTSRPRQECGCHVHEGTAVNRGLDTMIALWPELKVASSRLSSALTEIMAALQREGVTKQNVTAENLKKMKNQAEKSVRMNLSVNEVESFNHQGI